MLLGGVQREEISLFGGSAGGSPQDAEGRTGTEIRRHNARINATRLAEQVGVACNVTLRTDGAELWTPVAEQGIGRLHAIYDDPIRAGLR